MTHDEIYVTVVTTVLVVFLIMCLTCGFPRWRKTKESPWDYPL